MGVSLLLADTRDNVAGVATLLEFDSYEQHTNNDVIATIDAAACADFAKIKKGDKLLVWSSMMTMSLPAQTHPEKVVVLP